MSLSFRNVSGAGLGQYIAELARLRIRVFREFPYLYDGDPAYEERYLQTYLNAERSLMVLAVDSSQTDQPVIGASSALSLEDETEEVQRPFILAGMNPAEIFYCGESVLLPQYRGQGAGVEFFNRREAHARALGGFKTICFCAVDRPHNHPRRPDDYVPLDEFWQKRGYRKAPQLHTTFSWQDLDENSESEKPMIFWTKDLQG